MTDLFIGVVSHERSRFVDSQGPRGTAALLAAACTDLGLNVVTRVNTDDAYDPAQLPITRAVVQRCILAQSRLEFSWRNYLHADRPGMWGRLRNLAGGAVIAARLELTTASREAGVQMVRRLINIELSHLSLLGAGLESGADWILILEDDALAPDPQDAAMGLTSLVRTADAVPGYVNLSVSHTAAELGVAALMTHGSRWEGLLPRTVLHAARPVTNTVCAIAYRASFAAPLLRAMEAMPLDPVIPIDWKLNAALMEMFRSGQADGSTCWQVEPGPFQQRSMHA